MVGTTGLEPATSSVSRKRSNQLSYAPVLQQLVVYQDRGCGERRGLCGALPFAVTSCCSRAYPASAARFFSLAGAAVPAVPGEGVGTRVQAAHRSASNAGVADGSL